MTWKETKEIEEEEAEDDEDSGYNSADGEGESSDDELVEKHQEWEEVVLVEWRGVELLFI